MYKWKIFYDNGNTKILRADDVYSACDLGAIDYFNIICVVRID